MARSGAHPAPLKLVACPQCSGPAEIVEVTTLASFSGPVDVARTRCIDRHIQLSSVRRLQEL
jgi:hypothetical protein